MTNHPKDNAQDIMNNSQVDFFSGFKIAPPIMSWDKPIELELLSWARHMKQQNQRYIATSIWGRKQQRESEIYARVFEMVEQRIEREMRLRERL